MHGSDSSAWWSRGAAEVCIYGDVPRIKQPFWDIGPVPVSLAPGSQLTGVDIGFWRQSQVPRLHFELGRESWSEPERASATPVRVSASTSHDWAKRLSRRGSR